MGDEMEARMEARVEDPTDDPAELPAIDTGSSAGSAGRQDLRPRPRPRLRHVRSPRSRHGLRLLPPDQLAGLPALAGGRRRGRLGGFRVVVLAR